MAVHEVTEEEREQMIDHYLERMNIKRKHLSKEELEKEIIDYLGKKHPCSLATCGKNGVPRISVVDYINDGLIIYILSEGGKKFKNIRENNQVAIGIADDIGEAEHILLRQARPGRGEHRHLQPLILDNTVAPDDRNPVAPVPAFAGANSHTRRGRSGGPQARMPGAGNPECKVRRGDPAGVC